MKTIHLFDDTSIEITDDQAATIEDELVRGDLDYIRVNGQLLNPKTIARIAPSQATQADIFADPWAEPDHQVEAGRKCKGTKSLALEIMNRAKQQDGKTSPDNPDGLRHFKLLADKQWRERTRKQILKADPDWCDGQSGKCVCYAEA